MTKHEPNFSVIPEMDRSYPDLQFTIKEDAVWIACTISGIQCKVDPDGARVSSACARVGPLKEVIDWRRYERLCLEAASRVCIRVYGLPEPLFQSGDSVRPGK